MDSLPERASKFFMVVAGIITPEAAALDADGRARMGAIVDEALMDREASVRRQLASFLTVIRLAPVLRYGRTFDGLSTAQRIAVLKWFESGPVGLFRQGFWGLKVLVFMGYYGQPEHWSEIGYAPDFEGRAGVRLA